MRVLRPANDAAPVMVVPYFDARQQCAMPEPPTAPRGRAIAPSVDAVASRRLKHYRGSVKYMRPGNFMFLLLVLCEFWNKRRVEKVSRERNRKLQKAWDALPDDAPRDTGA